MILTSTIVGGELLPRHRRRPVPENARPARHRRLFFETARACEGIFHESSTLPPYGNLPVLYVCENNQWQAFVHRRETMHRDHVSERAASYAWKAPRWTATTSSVQSAPPWKRRNGAGGRSPFLLETYTYRSRGRFEPDDQACVDAAERAAWLAPRPHRPGATPADRSGRERRRG